MDNSAVCDIRLSAQRQVQMASQLIRLSLGAIIIGEKVDVFIVVIVVLPQGTIQDYLLVRLS